jgi:hypothetical protein
MATAAAAAIYTVAAANALFERFISVAAEGREAKSQPARQPPWRR